MSYPLTTPSVQFTTVYNNQLYAACSDGVRIFNVDTGTYVRTVTTVDAPVGVLVVENILYVTSDSNTLYSYDLANSDASTLILQGALSHPQAIVYYNNLLYIANFDTNQILSFTPGGTFAPPTIAITQPVGIYIDSASNTLYATSYPGRVGSYNATTGASINNEIASSLGTSYGIVYNNGYIYSSSYSGNQVLKIDVASGGSTNFQPSALPYGLTFYNNYLYVSNNGDGTVSRYLLSVPSVPCFKKGSKLLTNTGYKPIEELKKGDLIKTFANGYKPVCMIGTTTINHEALETRNKDQLYKCSQDKYPEVFEDLIITGSHSILVDEFASDKEKQKTIDVNGHLFVTEFKYRLPACADSRAKVYEMSGTHTIYHVALENDSYYGNYGIYANGLLVETCSKRYLKEFSNMKLL